MRRWAQLSVMALSMCCIVVLGSGIALQLSNHLDRGFERSGAGVAALVALFVVVQVSIERMHDERNREIEIEGAAAAGARPIDELSRRIGEARRTSFQEHLKAERRALILAVAFWACAGELVHGFGDLLVGGSDGDGNPTARLELKSKSEPVALQGLKAATVDTGHDVPSSNSETAP